jgi:AcrR family transcriptional regulator
MLDGRGIAVDRMTDNALNDDLGAFDKAEQRRRKRQAVVRVAATAFNRKGFANTTMDDVAAVMKISKPALYQYFESKQDLLYHCHQLSMDHGEAGIALARQAGGTAFERLRILLSRYMQGIFGDLGSCAVLTDVDSLEPKRRAEVTDRRARISAAVVKMIAEGVEDGSILNCDPKLASLFVLGVINWIPLWYRSTGPNKPEEIIDAFLNMLGSGLNARDTSRADLSQSNSGRPRRKSGFPRRAKK